MRITARDVTLLLLTVLLLGALTGYLLTRDNTPATSLSKVAAQPVKLVDQSPLETARSLSSLPSTADEQKLAAEALRLADHELDLAFATALQATELHPPAENEKTKELNQRIQRLQDRLNSVQQTVSRLTDANQSAKEKNDATRQQQLEAAQTRVVLLQDALDDAKQDLLLAGGDPQTEIKQELEQHETLQHGTSTSSASKPASFGAGGSLLSQFQGWRKLRVSYARLRDAQQQARDYSKKLVTKHDNLQKGLTDQLGDTDEPADTDSAPATDQANRSASLAQLSALSKNSKVLAMYDKRSQAETQLADLYGQWAVIVEHQVRAELHGMLRSLLLIVLALIGIVLAEGFVERFYMRVGPDRRRLGTMRLVLRFMSQVVGVVVILLVLFGPPSQLSTVLALGAAGLTVALKDFIVAFFGWFVLMGRHGIRSGDWVEINGIGGEVVEVGLLRTILLETGNWNDAGHPTGRKVSFVNSYAIEGHYFNFTTAGQWLWDELDVLIPAGEDPYNLTNSVLKLVTEHTQKDATQAEQEWRHAAKPSAIHAFSASPAIDVRPTNLGVNLVVRYVVNAQNRYDVRTRLYQAIVELLHAGRITQPSDKSLSSR